MASNLLYKALDTYSIFYNKFETCSIHWDKYGKKLYFKNTNLISEKPLFAHLIIVLFSLVVLTYLRFQDRFSLVKVRPFHVMIFVNYITVLSIVLTFEFMLKQYGESLTLCWNCVNQAELESRIGK